MGFRDRLAVAEVRWVTRPRIGWLWKLYLEVGPDIELFRWRLLTTRFISSDMGTESGLADVRDVLPEFFQWLGSDVTAPRQEFLWPLTVFSLGWHHCMDHVAEQVHGVSRDGTEGH